MHSMSATTGEEFNLEYGEAFLAVAKSIKLSKGAAEGLSGWPVLWWNLKRYLPLIQRSLHELDFSNLFDDEKTKDLLLKLADLRDNYGQFIERIRQLERMSRGKAKVPSFLAQIIIAPLWPQINAIEDLIDDKLETLAFSLSEDICSMIAEGLDELHES